MMASHRRKREPWARGAAHHRMDGSEDLPPIYLRVLATLPPAERRTYVCWQFGRVVVRGRSRLEREAVVRVAVDAEDADEVRAGGQRLGDLLERRVPRAGDGQDLAGVDDA